MTLKPQLTIICLCLCASLGFSKTITTAGSLGPALDPSLKNEAEAAIDRGLDFLATKQNDDGSWSNSDFPALTGLALWAFARSNHPEKATVVAKATTFITGKIQPNGGIYADLKGTRKGGGLPNYNTAVCLIALHALNNPEHTQTLLNARKFLAASQRLGTDDIYAGGWGYDASTKRAYTDLLSTYYTLEAMALTASVEDHRPAGQVKATINKSAATKFIDSNQNTTDDAGLGEQGGFHYRPDASPSPSVTNKDGVVYFRSYGSITYAGTLALLYSDVKNDDPRVLSAFDWAANHWTVDENPGMGQQGVFFFLNVMSKCMNATGRDYVQRAGSKEVINWREQLIKKLVSSQSIEGGKGFWVNENGRWWEKDPILTTAYSLLTLQQSYIQEN